MEKSTFLMCRKWTRHIKRLTECETRRNTNRKNGKKDGRPHGEGGRAGGPRFPPQGEESGAVKA